MSDDAHQLPPHSGGRSTLVGTFRARQTSKFQPRNFNVTVNGGGLGARFWGALATAVILGGAAGLEFGAGAGAARDFAAVVQPEASNAEVARLLHEVRGLRAQIEQIRHASETLRVADRLRALEAAPDAGLANQTEAKNAAAPVVSRLAELDARIARLERPGSDMTATGAIKPRAGKEKQAR